MKLGASFLSSLLMLALHFIVCDEDLGRLHGQVKSYPSHDVPSYYGLNTGLNETERFCLNNRKGYEVLIDDAYSHTEFCPEGKRCKCWFNEACKDVEPCLEIPKALPMIDFGTFRYESKLDYYYYYSSESKSFKGLGVVKQDSNRQMYLQINKLRSGEWKNFELIVSSKEGDFIKYTGGNLYDVKAAKWNDTMFCSKQRLKRFQPFGYDLPTNILTKSNRIGNTDKMVQEWSSYMEHDVISAIGVWEWKWTVIVDLKKKQMIPVKTFYFDDGQEDIHGDMFRKSQTATWSTSTDLDKSLTAHEAWYQKLVGEDLSKDWFQVPNICKTKKQ